MILDSEEEIYWETVETFTDCELEPEKNVYSLAKEGDETGMTLDSEDECYWEASEVVTNYESEPKKDPHWDNTPQNGETKGIKPDSGPKKRKILEGPARHKGRKYEI